MLRIQKLDNITEITVLKQAYFQQSSAPLDGMWHFGFVPQAEHFSFYEAEKLVGYCCINQDGFLLQYYLSPQANTCNETLFKQLITNHYPVIHNVTGAFVSTADTPFFALCLDNMNSIEVITYTYQQLSTPFDKNKLLPMQLITLDQLSDAVTFAIEAIGAPKEWLTEYYTNLINREELWGYRQDGPLIATGECRKVDKFQVGYADVGMIVAANHRGKGLATQILFHLKHQANLAGLQAICSTEKDNFTAQKSISRAGFITDHRIAQFNFGQ